MHSVSSPRQLTFMAKSSDNSDLPTVTSFEARCSNACSSLKSVALVCSCTHMHVYKHTILVKADHEDFFSTQRVTHTQSQNHKNKNTVSKEDKAPGDI